MPRGGGALLCWVSLVPPWLCSVTFPPSPQGFPGSCSGKVLPVRAGGSLRDRLVAATASPPSTTGKGTPGVPGNILVPPALLQLPQCAPSQRWGWDPPDPQVPAALSHPFPSDTATGDRGTPRHTPIPQEADTAHGALHPHGTHRKQGAPAGETEAGQREGRGGHGARLLWRQHPAPRWGSGGRDLHWGRGMRSPGQEIVGLGECRSRLLRKQAEAERQRGRKGGQGGQEADSGGRNAGNGQVCQPGAGQGGSFPQHSEERRGEAVWWGWQPLSSLGLAVPQFPQPQNPAAAVLCLVPSSGATTKLPLRGHPTGPRGMLGVAPGQACGRGDIAGSFLLHLWDNVAQNADWITAPLGNSTGM